MTTHIWYSGATDQTGKKIAEALEASHGNSKPGAAAKLVIAWGAKTDEAVKFPAGTKVLNHPDNIRENRNKLLALSKMIDAGVNVAPFSDNIADIGKKGKLTLPVIGRTKYHQGGKGFWSCPTMMHVEQAAAAGAQYFQNLIEIKDEFRIHTFDGKVIYAVKKVMRSQEEMEAAYIEDELIRQKDLATKAKEAFDEKMATSIIRRQAKKFAQDGANMMIRSNRLGWKFVRVKEISKELANESAAALKALGLDFGAVDACIDVKGNPWIIEVNTGPGLEGTTFDVYIEALKGWVKNQTAPTVGKLLGKLVGKKEAEAPKATATTTSSRKSSLLGTLSALKKMAEEADDSEAEVLDKLFSRVFGDK